jgi:FtsH-binding integral membrane protein
MTLGWVIAGTIGQVLLAYMLFLLGVFGFSAVGNTHRPTPFDFSVLNSALYAAPASCLISAVVVIGLYRSGAGEMSYLWYAAPILLFASYCLYVNLCIKRQ